MPLRLKVLFTTKCHLSGEVTGSSLVRGMQWIYFQEEVTEERDILLSKGRKNKKKVAAVKGDIQELS